MPFPADGIDVLNRMTERDREKRARAAAYETPRDPEGDGSFLGTLFKLLLLAIVLIIPWQLSSNRLPTPPATVQPKPGNSLNPGQTLEPGQQLRSTVGGYTLQMQQDGNLVLYAPNRQIMWASNTAGNVGMVLQLRTDGNLMLYVAGSRIIWASNTAGNPDSALILQGDGNLVLYVPGNRAIWWSNR